MALKNVLSSIQSCDDGVDQSNPVLGRKLENWRAGVPIFFEHWGDNLQFYPNFALFSTLGGMNLDHDFFQVSKLSEDQKKRSSPKMKHFFSPNSGEDPPKTKVFTKNGTLFPEF